LNVSKETFFEDNWWVGQKKKEVQANHFLKFTGSKLTLSLTNTNMW